MDFLHTPSLPHQMKWIPVGCCPKLTTDNACRMPLADQAKPAGPRPQKHMRAGVAAGQGRQDQNFMQGGREVSVPLLFVQSVLINNGALNKTHLYTPGVMLDHKHSLKSEIRMSTSIYSSTFRCSLQRQGFRLVLGLRPLWPTADFNEVPFSLFPLLLLLRIPKSSFWPLWGWSAGRGK